MTNYYSERIGLIEHISAKMRRYGQDKDKETAQDYKALQYGFVSDFVRSEYDQFGELENYDKSVEPTQEELCSYGNFFKKYPNKTVDKKFLSTSFYFSVQSKATLEESIKMLKREIDKLKKNKSTPSKSKTKVNISKENSFHNELHSMSNSKFTDCIDIKEKENGHVHICDCNEICFLAFTPQSESYKDYKADKGAFLYNLHLSIIKKAIDDGYKVPQEVLKEYPKLEPKKIQHKTDKLKLKMKAKALQLRRKRALALLKMESSGLSGLDGVLGALGETDKKEISKNKDRLASLIAKENTSKKRINSFDDNFKRYNKGITEAEIKAWVWFKQSQGSPMRGWEKYFLKSTGKVEDVLVTTKATTIRDNHFRDDFKAPVGAVLGKPTRFENEYDKKIYQIFTDKEGNKKYVNKDHIALQKTEATTDQKELDKLIKEGALFFGEADFLPLPLYTFGNIYDRILSVQAKKNTIVEKYGQSVYDNHIEVLNNAKPTTLSVINPDATKRLKILPFSTFAQEFMMKNDADGNEVGDEEGISLNGFFRIWLRQNAELIETQGISTYNIIHHYLDGGSKPKEEKEFIEKYSRAEGDRLFDIFLHTALSINDQKKLDMSWNRQYNGFANLNYKRIPIGLETSALFKGMPISFMEAQREAIAYIDAVTSGCLAYDVGVGKTMSAILILAQNIQNGTYKRPLIVVPKPTYEKWKNEINGYTDKDGNFIEGVLSGLGIKINDFGNMGNSYVNPKTINKKVDEKSITIVSYEGFSKIGFSERLEQDLLVDLSSILLQSNKKGSLKDSQRDLEQQYEKLRALVGRTAKGTVCDIDVLGLDAIIIDEAHNFRNVFSFVPSQEGVKRYSTKGSTSGRAQSAFMLCNYVQRKFGGNVVLLTATPFNNSPLEVYSILSLIALNKMEKVGVKSLAQFMETFIQETHEIVVTPSNKLAQKPVVKSFQNKKSLQSLVFSYINFKSGEDAGVRRPVKINLPRLSYKNDQNALVHLKPNEQLTTYLKMNSMQEEYQQDAIVLAETGSGFKEKGKNVLIAMSMSRKNAFSPFLLSDDKPEDYLDFVENSPKIKYTMECIKSVQEHHKKTSTPISGQVIYSNIGKVFFPLIKEYLEKELKFKKGITFNRKKFDEVEIVTGDGTAARKEAIKEAFLDGTVKIIIGSSTIREGIDLQKKGTVLYNLYPDYNPTDIRQLEGRIWRQGNRFGYVRVVMPLIQNSMDVFIFQKLEEKSSRINDIWAKATDDSNVLDQESLDPEAVKYALYTNIDKLVLLKIAEMEMEISRSRNKIENELATLREVEMARNSYSSSKKFVQEKLQDFKILANNFVENNKDSKDKEVVKNKEKYISIVEDINAYDGIDDKKLVRVALRISYVYRNYFDYVYTDHLGKFRGVLGKINKSESILAKYDGNINEAIDKIQNLLEEQDKKLEELKEPTVKGKIYDQIVEEKKKLNITGRSAQEAAKDFASLNYLLDYKMADVDDVNGNPLPTDKPKSAKSVKLIPPTENKTKIKLKMKAKALQLRRKRALALLKLAS